MKVEIYTKDNCSYCIQAKKIFENKGWKYIEYHIRLETKEILLEELATRLGFVPRTVPQIFIDDQIIGGYTDLVAWLKN